MKLLKRCFLFCLFLILTSKITSSWAQQVVRIRAYLHGASASYAYAYLYRTGHQWRKMGQNIIQGDSVVFEIPLLNISEGVYRLQYSAAKSNKYIDFIVDKKESEIAFELDVEEPQGINFLRSKLNKDWYTYRQERDRKYHDVMILAQFLQNYTNLKAEIYLQAEKAFEREKEETMNFKKAFVDKNASNFAGHIAKSTPMWFPKPQHEPLLQDFYRQENFWQQIDTRDTTLLNTPLFSELILDYMRYYMNPSIKISQNERLKGFVSSVDTVMYYFSTHESLRKYAFNYLVRGFKEIGQEEVLRYLDEKYGNVNLCESEKSKISFEERMKGYKALKNGSIAPNIVFKDDKGNSRSLMEIKSDSTLVVFWATWCNHCKDAMPKLNAILNKHPQVKTLAVSLDTSESDFVAMKSKLTQMSHYYDGKKWDSTPAQEYYVLATPTFFLLDKDKHIISRFSSVEDLPFAK